MEPIGEVSDPESLNPTALGFMCGLEIHQQLDTGKLHSRMPSELFDFKFEEIRIKRYRMGRGNFLDHVDVGSYDSAMRFLVLFVYLNDVEEGGETKFVNVNKPGTYLPYTITPKRGRLLMFPPTWQYYHAGLKPKSGKKYLLHSYCHYG